ncbi:hypothetical protein [Pseudonocardia sp.]|uniref:hypothetical protein n=1 Tax=Pseudonocardia sp. TaxID=60912 RepID=UPI003D0B96DF
MDDPPLLADYERALTPVRAGHDARRSVRRLTDPATPADVLLAFWIHHCALGVAMTEPVEGWIRRAGRAVTRAGDAWLGRALDAHASAEADHHLLMLADLDRLVARWNATHSPLDTAELLGRPPTEPVRRYRGLHEDVIAGPAPHAQLAIENEIELLSVRIGPGLVETVGAVLGPEVVAELSFLTDHVELDVGHAHFNRRQLGRLLDARPDLLAPLVTAGTAALAAYGDYLDACLDCAERLASARA